MLNFFETTINVDVIIEDGNIEVINNGRSLMKGTIDSCITSLRQDINNLPSEKTVVFFLKNRSQSSSGLVENQNIVTNKLHMLASNARCTIIIKRGLDYYC